MTFRVMPSTSLLASESSFEADLSATVGKLSEIRTEVLNSMRSISQLSHRLVIHQDDIHWWEWENAISHLLGVAAADRRIMQMSICHAYAKRKSAFQDTAFSASAQGCSSSQVSTSLATSVPPTPDKGVPSVKPQTSSVNASTKVSQQELQAQRVEKGTEMEADAIELKPAERTPTWAQIAKQSP
jgi:hypothetical protein